MADRTEALVLQMSADIRKMERALSNARGQTNRQLGAIEQRFDKMNAHVKRSGDRMAGDLRAAIAGLAVGALAGDVIKYADAWTVAGNKLAAAGTQAAELAEVQSRLADLALSTRSDFEGTVSLYTRLMRATSELAVSQKELFRATEIANKAFKAGGGAASEQRAAVMQLGQALGSGILAGDELRSIRENAPILAKAIAEEFGTTIAGLKKLGAEGELTSVRVFKAILRAGADIDKQFAVTTSTVADAFTNLETAAVRYVGQANKASGATQSLAGFINMIAQDFDRFADAAIVAAQVLGGTLAAGAIVRLVAALGTLVVGIGAAATAARGLGLAMTFATGPWGLAILAIAAAVATFSLNIDKAQTSTERFEDRMRSVKKTIDGAQATIEESTFKKLGKEAAEALTPLEEFDRKIAAINKHMRETGDAAKGATLGRLSLEKGNVREDLRALEAEQKRLQQPLVLEGGVKTAFTVGTEPELAQIAEQIGRLKKAEADLNKLLQEAARSTFKGEGGGGGVDLGKSASELKLFATASEDFAKAIDEIRKSSEGSSNKSRATVQAVLDYAKAVDDVNGVVLAITPVSDMLLPGDSNLLFQELDKLKEKLEDIVDLGDVVDRGPQLPDLDDVLRNHGGFDSNGNVLTPEMGEFRESFRESVKAGLRDGIRDDDWGQALRNVVADALISGFDNAIDRFADLLFDLFSNGGGFEEFLSAGVALLGGGSGSSAGQSIGMKQVAAAGGDMRSMSQGSMIDMSVTVQGSVDAVSLPQFQQALDTQRRQILATVPSIANATMADNRKQKRRI